MTCEWCRHEPCAPWCLVDIDRKLVATGWNPISPWWWNVLREARRARDQGVRNIIVQGGRRGGKSTTLCRLAVSEVLDPVHEIPPDDVGFYAIISAGKDQAKKRLQTCKKIFDVLDIDVHGTAEEIVLKERPVGVKIFAATLQGVVSFTSIGALCDEEARWKDPDNGANPAKEVLGTLAPTMATMPNAQTWHVSTPWAKLGAHWEKVESGNDESQRVFCGATWEMNPTITESQTLLLERDYATWLREYKGEPMASDESKFFSAEFIDAALERATRKKPAAYLRVVAGADFAFRRNSSAMIALGRDGETLTVVVGEERIPGARPLVPSQTITELAEIAQNNGADSLCCDLHYIETVRETIDALDMPLVEYPSTNDGNVSAYIRTRVLLSEGRLDLTWAPEKLIEQLKDTTGKPTTTGITIQNKVKDGAHGDLVSALVCAVWAADQAPPEPGNFVGPRRFRRGAVANGDDTLTDMPPPEWDE